ncbi:hypothetical protein AK812_SmicGene6843 [Symbiodinium microadriaticum]|uniref:Uncharacterized protein n=1 Tax=Symbiodinium microadriaticum TaxID=2951 RepID=A0A1Q9EQ82_SYMMI|nr:hypothetical protein AK812_SmicGene6843 [Symbiodinium microadriaticum]
MPRPSQADLEDAARQLADEVTQKLNGGALFAAVRNICTDSKVDDTESVKKKFSVGTDTAKKIHAAAMKLLKDQGFKEFQASMGKQMKFCKPGREVAAKADESRSTYHEFVERYDHTPGLRRPKSELPEPAAKPALVKKEEAKTERPRLVKIKVQKNEKKEGDASKKHRKEEVKRRRKEKRKMKKMKKEQKEKRRQLKERKKRKRAAELAGEKLKAVLHEKKRRREEPSPQHSQSSDSSSSSSYASSYSPAQPERRMKQELRPAESAEAPVRGTAQPPGQAFAASRPPTAGLVPAAPTAKAEQSPARRRWPAAIISPKVFRRGKPTEDLRIVFVEDVSDEAAVDPRPLEVPPPIASGPSAAPQRGEASAPSKAPAASQPPAPKGLPTAAKSKAPAPGERAALPTAAGAGEASASSAPAALRASTPKRPPTAAKSKAPTPVQRAALPTAAPAGQASAPSEAQAPAISRPATPVEGVIDVESFQSLAHVAMAMEVDEDDEAPLLAQLGGTSSGSASSSQAPRSVLDPFNGIVPSFDEFKRRARNADPTQRIPRLRDRRPENGDDVDATLEQLQVLNDLLQRSQWS